MKRFLGVCLVLGVMGCGKEPESKVENSGAHSVVQRHNSKTAAAGSAEKSPAGKARPKLTPALQREVDAFLKEPPLKVTASDLINAYQNEEVGDKEFKGRKVWVTGYMLRTGFGPLNSAYVELEPGKGQSGAVRCFVERGRGLPLEDLKEGQEVTIEGRVSAKTGPDIRLNDCRLRTPAEIQSISEAAVVR